MEVKQRVAVRVKGESGRRRRRSDAMVAILGLWLWELCWYGLEVKVLRTRTVVVNWWWWWLLFGSFIYL
jgi:hypothetical protein